MIYLAHKTFYVFLHKNVDLMVNYVYAKSRNQNFSQNPKKFNLLIHIRCSFKLVKFEQTEFLNNILSYLYQAIYFYNFLSIKKLFPS